MPPARRCARAAARPVRGRRDPGRRRHLDQHERQRGDRQPRARAARPRSAASTQLPAPARTRQPEPEHQRRLSDRGQARAAVRHPAAAGGRWRCCSARSKRRPPSSPTCSKLGRTQLQDAVPMTLGQEFSTYAVMLGEDEQRLAEAVRLIREINLGATAIGTGINAHPDYAALVATHLAEIDRHRAVHRAATWSRRRRTRARSCSSRACSSASRSSSPRSATTCGCCPRDRARASARSTCRRVQAGSSIMPGKVNPVIPEVVNQIAFEVIGNDITVSFAAEAGQLQLNAFEPIIAHSLFKSLEHLAAGCRTLAERCVNGITANREHLRRSSRTRSAWSPRSTRSSATRARPRSRRRRSRPAPASTTWCSSKN